MLWKHDIFVRGMDMGEKCTHPLTMTVWVTLGDSMEVWGGGGSSPANYHWVVGRQHGVVCV